jgi:hypothetical protein
MMNDVICIHVCIYIFIYHSMVLVHSILLINIFLMVCIEGGKKASPDDKDDNGDVIYVYTFTYI